MYIYRYTCEVCGVLSTRWQLLHGSKGIGIHRESRRDLNNLLHRSPLCKIDHVITINWPVLSRFPDPKVGQVVDTAFLYQRLELVMVWWVNLCMDAVSLYK
jgi:hypothetical protein